MFELIANIRKSDSVNDKFIDLKTWIQKSV